MNAHAPRLRGVKSSGVLDSHQHFWRVSRGDYEWLKPDAGVLYRDFEPQHLRPILEECGVDRTILVQAAPTVSETRFLLDLAERNEFIAGIVGWVDLEDARATETLDELCANPRFLGVRPMVQDIADPRWLLQETLTPAVRTLVDRELIFDALIRPHHMRALLQFCERHPDLEIVLDHAAKPNIAAHVFEPWGTELRELAKNPQLRCKLSGLVTEAGAPDYDAIAPYVEHVLECFGAQRVMWGSDWPVCETICSYREWFALSERLLARLSAAERTAVLGEVARNTYEPGSHTPSGRRAHA
jgi:L-fuconolactonase